MEEKKVLKATVDAVTDQTITFDLDIQPKGKIDAYLQKIGLRPRKRSFEIKPLTLYQLQKISKLLLPIELEFTPNGILQMMLNHGRACAEIVAISVTASRQTPTNALIDLFFHSLSKKDMETAINIVLQQMHTLDFLNTIVSIRSLNVMETKKLVSVPNAEKSETSPIVPGVLSAVS